MLTVSPEGEMLTTLLTILLAIGSALRTGPARTNELLTDLSTSVNAFDRAQIHNDTATLARPQISRSALPHLLATRSWCWRPWEESRPPRPLDSCSAAEPLARYMWSCVSATRGLTDFVLAAYHAAAHVCSNEDLARSRD